MTGYNDHDPVSPNLELSQGGLESLQLSLADVLIRRGKMEEMTGLYPATPDGSPVKAWTYPLPSERIKELFYPNDDEVIIRNEAEAKYIAPHRIADAPEEAIFEIIEVFSAVRLVGTDILYHETRSVVKKDGVFSAQVEGEYNENDKWITPNLGEFNRYMSFDEDKVDSMEHEYHALDSPFTLNDAEKLRKIVAFIEGAS